VCTYVFLLWQESLTWSWWLTHLISEVGISQAPCHLCSFCQKKVPQPFSTFTSWCLHTSPPSPFFLLHSHRHCAPPCTAVPCHPDHMCNAPHSPTTTMTPPVVNPIITELIKGIKVLNGGCYHHFCQPPSPWPPLASCKRRRGPLATTAPSPTLLSLSPFSSS
jgi:hypothetical protein